MKSRCFVSFAKTHTSEAHCCLSWDESSVLACSSRSMHSRGATRPPQRELNSFGAFVFLADNSKKIGKLMVQCLLSSKGVSDLKRNSTINSVFKIHEPVQSYLLEQFVIVC